MIQKLRERMGKSEGGFTLVELLVVMLILGLLAAIAIPSFFNQRDKAKDADAKSAARTAQTAMETYATDNGGSYAGAVVSDLTSIESTLTGRVLSVTDDTGAGAPGAKNYEVTSQSSTGTDFSIIRHDDGTTELTCTPVSTGGCPSDGNWGK